MAEVENEPFKSTDEEAELVLAKIRTIKDKINSNNGGFQNHTKLDHQRDRHADKLLKDFGKIDSLQKWRIFKMVEDQCLEIERDVKAQVQREIKEKREREKMERRTAAKEKDVCQEEIVEKSKELLKKVQDVKKSVRDELDMKIDYDPKTQEQKKKVKFTKERPSVQNKEKFMKSVMPSVRIKEKATRSISSVGHSNVKSKPQNKPPASLVSKINQKPPKLKRDENVSTEQNVKTFGPQLLTVEDFLPKPLIVPEKSTTIPSTGKTDRFAVTNGNYKSSTRFKNSVSLKKSENKTLNTKPLPNIQYNYPIVSSKNSVIYVESSTKLGKKIPVLSAHLLKGVTVEPERKKEEEKPLSFLPGKKSAVLLISHQDEQTPPALKVEQKNEEDSNEMRVNENQEKIPTSNVKEEENTTKSKILVPDLKAEIAEVKTLPEQNNLESKSSKTDGNLDIPSLHDDQNISEDSSPHISFKLPDLKGDDVKPIIKNLSSKIEAELQKDSSENESKEEICYSPDFEPIEFEIKHETDDEDNGRESKGDEGRLSTIVEISEPSRVTLSSTPFFDKDEEDDDDKTSKILSNCEDGSESTLIQEVKKNLDLRRKSSIVEVEVEPETMINREEESPLSSTTTSLITSHKSLSLRPSVEVKESHVQTERLSVEDFGVQTTRVLNSTSPKLVKEPAAISVEVQTSKDTTCSKDVQTSLKTNVVDKSIGVQSFDSEKSKDISEQLVESSSLTMYSEGEILHLSEIKSEGEIFPAKSNKEESHQIALNNDKMIMRYESDSLSTINEESASFYD